jgi:hypothetical protein
MLSMNAASGTGKPTGTMFPFGNNIVSPFVGVSAGLADGRGQRPSFLSAPLFA